MKSGGDNISYGAFAKGAGDHYVFERNVVLCEYKHRGQAGERIGLSFGGGGTGPEFLRDARASGSEQISSIMRDNLIAFCSDEERGYLSDIEKLTRRSVPVIPTPAAASGGRPERQIEGPRRQGDRPEGGTEPR